MDDDEPPSRRRGYLTSHRLDPASFYVIFLTKNNGFREASFRIPPLLARTKQKQRIRIVFVYSRTCPPKAVGMGMVPRAQDPIRVSEDSFRIENYVCGSVF